MAKCYFHSLFFRLLAFSGKMALYQAFALLKPWRSILPERTKQDGGPAAAAKRAQHICTALQRIDQPFNESEIRKGVVGLVYCWLAKGAYLPKGAPFGMVHPPRAGRPSNSKMRKMAENEKWKIENMKFKNRK